MSFSQKSSARFVPLFNIFCFATKCLAMRAQPEVSSENREQIGAFLDSCRGSHAPTLCVEVC